MSGDDSSDGDVTSPVHGATPYTPRSNQSSPKSNASVPQPQDELSQYAAPESGSESDSTPSHRSSQFPAHHGSDVSDLSSADLHEERGPDSPPNEGDNFVPLIIKKEEPWSSPEAESFDGPISDVSDEERDEIGEITGVNFYPEEEIEDENAPAQPLHAEIPHVPACLKQSEVFHVKMPNFLSIHTKPFRADIYKDEENEDESEKMDEEGRNHLKLKVENVLRWRFVEDPVTGELKKESNAKMVKWSDGTMSMYLGKEIFDVLPQPMGEFCHCFARTPSGLVERAIFDKKVNFRPHSTESITHKKMTMNMADRTTKTNKVQVLAEVSTIDPTQEQKEKIRLEEEAIRARERKEATSYRRPRWRGYRAGYYGDDSEDEESLGFIKRMYTRTGRYDGPFIGESDSDSENGASKDVPSDDSDEEFRRKQMKKKKVVMDDDEDEDEA